MKISRSTISETAKYIVVLNTGDIYYLFSELLNLQDQFIHTIMKISRSTISKTAKYIVVFNTGDIYYLFSELLNLHEQFIHTIR